MLKYFRVSYQLPDDVSVTKHTRRCVKPKYDNGRETYLLAPPHHIRVVHSSNPLFHPFHERLSSVLMKNVRMPTLPEYHWLDAEEYISEEEYPIGTRIQIYSIMNALNQTTRFYMERVDHPTMKWKRIIMSFHVSEHCLFLPHKVKELPFEDDDIHNKIDSCGCVTV